MSPLTIKNNINVSFRGLKDNLRVGEDVLRDFKKAYPKLYSNSAVKVLIVNARRNGICDEQLLLKLEEIAAKYSKGIVSSRKKIYETQVPYPTLDSFVKRVEEVISENNFANCQECSDLIQYRLLKQKEIAHNISMRVIDFFTGDYFKNGNHVFTVFGLKKDADAINPNTWGNNAVIVDGWKNVVMRAQDALEYFDQHFGIDPDRHAIEYKLVDRVKIPTSVSSKPSL